MILDNIKLRDKSDLSFKPSVFFVKYMIISCNTFHSICEIFFIDQEIN